MINKASSVDSPTGKKILKIPQWRLNMSQPQQVNLVNAPVNNLSFGNSTKQDELDLHMAHDEILRANYKTKLKVKMERSSKEGSEYAVRGLKRRP
ncbi:MAG: hypothetical protein MZV70_11385 [Desulfobacterales bacterium]|nr:hypothetical protein [Desulfobacterales bacterium]